MGLRDALEVLVGSEPFERLLLERQRPIVARAEAGEDFVVAGVATALEAPLLAVAPGPREAEALAADLEAFLGPERVALLPAWEALPYEGISPAPEIAARRAGTVARMREAKGAFVLVAPVLAAMQGLIPRSESRPRCSSWQGLDLPPDALAERLVDLGYARSDVVEHRASSPCGGAWSTCSRAPRAGRSASTRGDEIESIWSSCCRPSSPPNASRSRRCRRRGAGARRRPARSRTRRGRRGA